MICVSVSEFRHSSCLKIDRSIDDRWRDVIGGNCLVLSEEDLAGFD